MSEKRYSIRQITMDTLVSAAFLAPGTMLSCLISGASYGYGLLWALVLSTLVSACIQGQMVRLGIVTQKGYLQNLLYGGRKTPFHALWGAIVSVTVFLSAICIETANLSSFQLGVLCFSYDPKDHRWFYLFVVVVAILLITRWVRVVEMVLAILVALVSLLFVISCLQSNTEWSHLWVKLLPTVENTEEAWLCVCCLFGTVVFPYSLYSISGQAARYWEKDLQIAHLNSFICTLLSGCISMMILLAAGDLIAREEIAFSTKNAIATLAQLFGGSMSQMVMGICLLLTAFANALFIPSFLSASIDPFFPKKGWVSPVASTAVLLGAFLVAEHWFVNPFLTVLKIICVNSILLPVLPIGCLVMMNRKSLGAYRNSLFDNLILGCITLILLVVSYQAIWVIF